MDKSNGPKGNEPKAAPDLEPERTKIARHRFAEGETRVMRLDEILRQRGAQEEPAAAARPQAPAPAAGAKLNSQEKQILATTEPAEHTVMVRREDLFAKGRTPAAPPAPPKAPAPPAAGAGAGAFATETRVFSLKEIAKQTAAPEAERPPAAPAPQRGPPSPPPAASAVAKDAPPSAPAPASRAASRDLTPPPSFVPASRKEPPPAKSAAPPPPPAEAARPAAAPSPGRLTAEPTLAAVPPPPPDAARVAEALAKGQPLPLAEGEAAKASQAAVAQAAGKVSAAPARDRRVANQVTVLFSSKGGAGATSLATATAHATVGHKHSACVMDLDLQLGDALAAWGLPPRLSLAQAILALGEGQGLGKHLLPSHASGVHVVSQVGNLNDLEKITPESMSALVAGLRLNFESVVIDGVRDFGDNELAVLDGADKVALVMVQEVLSARRARWAYSILGKIGFEAEDVSIVVNRFSPTHDISLGSIRQMFPGSAVVPVAANAALVTQALDRGVPLRELKADAGVTHAMYALADHLVYDAPPPAQEAAGANAMPQKKGLMQRLFGRKQGATP